MNFLLFIVAALGLIWGLNVALRVSSLFACALFLVVAGAVGYEYLNFGVAGISLSLDRIVLLGLIASFVIQHKLGKTAPKPMAQAEFVLFAFFAILVGNTFFYGTSSSDPLQVPILPHLIEGYIIPLFLYWIGRRSTVSEKAMNRVYGLLGAFGIYLAITAMFEAAGMWSLVFPKIIANPDLGIHFGRARGPFLQSVRLGLYLFVGMAAIWIPLVWRRVWGKNGLLLGLCLTPLFLAAILATLTRSIWMGTGIAALILFSLTLSGRPRRAVILLMMAGVLGAALMVGGGFNSLKREYGAAETEESTSMRVVFAYVSWLMVKDRPLTGHGFGHFPHKKRPYLNDRNTKLELGTIRGYIHHNTFLSLMVELGLFGFLLFIAFVASWYTEASRLWKDCQAPDWMRGQALMFIMLVPFYTIQMLFHDVTYSTLENGLLFFMAGLTSSLWSTRSAKQTVKVSTPTFDLTHAGATAH